MPEVTLPAPFWPTTCRCQEDAVAVYCSCLFHARLGQEEMDQYVLVWERDKGEHWHEGSGMEPHPVACQGRLLLS